MIPFLKKSILPAVLLCGCMAANAETINGAGASFPAPVYAAWTYTYNKVNPAKDHFNYQSVGSGAGVSQLKAGTVDFAGSDDPVKESDLQKYGLLQFPMLIGGIVPVVNLPGIKIKNVSVILHTVVSMTKHIESLKIFYPGIKPVKDSCILFKKFLSIPAQQGYTVIY